MSNYDEIILNALDFKYPFDFQEFKSYIFRCENFALTCNFTLFKFYFNYKFIILK